jgi:hypothetical protein
MTPLRLFCEKTTAKPEDAELIKIRYESEASKKMRQLLRFELYPALAVFFSCVLIYKFREQLFNIANFTRLSEEEEKYTARKIATLLKCQK